MKKFNFFKDIGIFYVIIWFSLRFIEKEIDNPNSENLYIELLLIIGPAVATILYLIFIYGFVKLGKQMNNKLLIVSSNILFFYSLIFLSFNYITNILDYKIEVLSTINMILHGFIFFVLGYSIYKIHRQIGLNSKALSIFIMLFGIFQMSYVLAVFSYILHIFLIITIIVLYSQLNKTYDI